MRDDYNTLRVELGLSDEEITELGLLEPASGTPDEQAEAYLRRSKKREDVAALRGHLRDMVKRAREVGVTIRHVWFEQLSASKRSVTRREYANALAAVMAGQSKTFLVWKLDRFDRRGAGSVLSAVDELDTRKARLVTCVEHLDSTTKGARMFIAIYAEQARGEVEDIALRVQNGHATHKAEGRRGTGRPPFGLQSPKGSGIVEHHPDEYPTARLLADLMLAGEGTRIAAHKLNERGLLTRGGHTWSATAVSKLVQSPLFAGIVPIRERQVDEYGNKLDTWAGYGEPLYRDDGTPVTCGTGVITPAEYFKIRVLIRERVNPFTRKGKRAGTYLLNPVLRCGRCNGPMHGGGGKYHCSTRVSRGVAVCAGVVSSADRLQATVEDMWLTHVAALEPDDPELYEIGRHWLQFADPETEQRVQHSRDALDRTQERLTELQDRYWNPPPGAFRMTAEEFERQALRLSVTIEDLKRVVSSLGANADVSALVDIDQLRAAWSDADLTLKRVLLRATWPQGIRLKPATRRGDPTPIRDRLKVVGLDM